jgi:hypothetical protein
MILLETLIFEDESGIGTIRPSNEDVNGGSQVIELSDDNEELFVTPILLDKKKRRVAPVREGTEEEDSEVERQLRGKKATSSPVKTQNFKKTDKVR